MLKKLPSKNEVGRFLRGYRYESGMTAAEAGEVIGKRASTIYKYESAKLPISETDLLALLFAYDVDLDTAFEGLPHSANGCRRKNQDARKERELIGLFNDLSPRQRDLLLEIARWGADSNK